MIASLDSIFVISERLHSNYKASLQHSNITVTYDFNKAKQNVSWTPHARIFLFAGTLVSACHAWLIGQKKVRAPRPQLRGQKLARNKLETPNNGSPRYEINGDIMVFPSRCLAVITHNSSVSETLEQKPAIRAMMIASEILLSRTIKTKLWIDNTVL